VASREACGVVRGGVVVVGPLLAKPGDGGRGRAGGRAEKAFEGRYEVVGGQARAGTATATPQPPSATYGTTAAGSPTGTANAVPIPCRCACRCRRCPYLHDAGRGHHVPRLRMAVAHHQPSAPIITLLRQLGQVGVDFPPPTRRSASAAQLPGPHR